MDIKELEKLIKLSKRHGIHLIKYQDVELEFSESYQPAKRIRRKANQEVPSYGSKAQEPTYQDILNHIYETPEEAI